MCDNSHGELYWYQTLWIVFSAWLINTLLSSYQAKKRVGESTQAMLVFVCTVSKEALLNAGFGDSYKPKSTPLTGVQYVSVHCVLILVLGYITLKRATTAKY